MGVAEPPEEPEALLEERPGTIHLPRDHEVHREPIATTTLKLCCVATPEGEYAETAPRRQRVRDADEVTASSRLTTQIEQSPDRARFVIEASDPLYQECLAHLGYAAIGEARFATAWFRRSPSTARCYERFAASIEQMVLQKARLVEVPWEDALLEFLRRVEGTDVRWWVYGSAALAVRGFEVEPGDVDINVSDTALAGRIFDDLLVAPVLEMQGWVAKRIGRAFYKAIFEWLSEPHAELDDQTSPHEQGPLVADQVETVQWRGHRVWVPPLTAQLATCKRRGLAERVELMRAAMQP
jgi:hypothetical protein